MRTLLSKVLVRSAALCQVNNAGARNIFLNHASLLLYFYLVDPNFGFIDPPTPFFPLEIKVFMKYTYEDFECLNSP